MKLQWFEVQGYKNLRAPLRLEELGDSNVIHGDNNVGKSNLLESIGLLFVLLQALREDARGGPNLAESFRLPQPGTEVGLALGRATVRSSAYFTERGFPPEDIFNLQDPAAIEVQACVRLDAAERAEGDPPWMTQPLTLGVRLERGEEELAIRLHRLVRSDGVDLMTPLGQEAEVELKRVLERFGPRRRGAALDPRFALIRADRTIGAEPLPPNESPSPLSTREPMSRDLGLALHDAEFSPDPSLRRQFERFLASLEHFRPILGDGRWRMHYDTRAARAELFFDAPGRAPTPLRLLGSGIQQIVNLAGRLLMTGADIAAVEEPELNLRYRAQLQLREVLRAIVGGATGPAQLLLTSHSPAFEIEPTFYALLPSPDGPRIERRPREQALRFTDPEVHAPPEGARAPLSYVTTDGLVRVPEDVRRQLGLQQGGGVAFVEEKETGHFRMLSDAQFLDLIETSGESP